MGESTDSAYRARLRADAKRLYRRNYTCVILTLIVGILGCGVIFWLGNFYLRLYGYAVVVALVVSAVGLLGTGLYTYPVGKGKMFLMSLCLSLATVAFGITPMFGLTLLSIPAWFACGALPYAALSLHDSILESMKNHANSH